MSEPATGAVRPTFLRAFVPGLVVGLVVGLLAGAYFSTIITEAPRTDVPLTREGARPASTPKERDARETPAGETPEGVAPAAPDGATAPSPEVPGKKPDETPVPGQSPPGAEPGAPSTPK